MSCEVAHRHHWQLDKHSIILSNYAMFSNDICNCLYLHVDQSKGNYDVFVQGIYVCKNPKYRQCIVQTMHVEDKL